MKARATSLFAALALLGLLLGACAPTAEPTAQPAGTALPRVLAVESFLADMAQNVAGDRLTVTALIPPGVDPHGFEPTPQDAARIADAQVLIINGAGLETWLDKVLQNAGGQRQVIVASDGLQSRTSDAGEPLAPGEVDPHFWLDPQMAIHYVAQIRDGLSQADPAGTETYARNAAAYTASLQELDAWISSQIAAIPPERRVLVTNHEDFGYYAARYGFKVVGAIVPNVSSEASPSARQLAGLVDAIRAAQVPAIFLEAGANPQIADQLARETGIRVVVGLYTHSLSAPDGPAPTYVAMLKHDTTQIVDALK